MYFSTISNFFFNLLYFTIFLKITLSLAGDGRCKGIHREVFTEDLTSPHPHCDLPPLICHSPTGNSHEHHLPTLHPSIDKMTERSWVWKIWPLNSIFMLTSSS